MCCGFAAYSSTLHGLSNLPFCLPPVCWCSVLQLEMALGRFPYKPWDSVFDQLDQVVNGAAPRLENPDNRWSEDFVSFVAVW